MLIKIKWINLILLSNITIVCCLPDTKKKQLLTNYIKTHKINVYWMQNAIKRNTCKTGGSLSLMTILLIPFWEYNVILVYLLFCRGLFLYKKNTRVLTSVMWPGLVFVKHIVVLTAFDNTYKIIFCLKIFFCLKFNSFRKVNKLTFCLIHWYSIIIYKHSLMVFCVLMWHM